MFDRCEIGRPTGDADPLTGLPTIEPAYAGRCEVSTYEPQETNTPAGGAVYTVQRYRFKVPVGSYGPQVGDVATVTESRQDPHLVGRTFRVVALHHETSGTAYRLGAEEVL